MKLQYPVLKPRISSLFGPRTMYGKQNFHTGLDFLPQVPRKDGDSIFATASGTVKVVANDPKGYGNYVVIDHGDFCTLYAHLSKSFVKVGEVVSAGKVIAFMGNTGHSTGTHLHFELRLCPFSKFWERKELLGAQKSKHAVNPLPYFNKN